LSQIAFLVLSVVVVAASLMVVLAANPVTSAFSLIVSLFGVAALFALAGNGFLAVIQVLIYAGAIVTLFIFVVMLLNLKAEELTETGINLQKVTGGVAAALIAVNVAALSNVNAPGGAAPILSNEEMLENMARIVFDRMGLPFELMSLLLLVALVGVIALARRDKAEKTA
jgi:NADH-quinone oxidoreductase subunit J